MRAPAIGEQRAGDDGGAQHRQRQREQQFIAKYFARQIR